MIKETKLTYPSCYELGYDAYYDGTKEPGWMSEQDRKEWRRGWRAADRYEEWRLDRAGE